MRLQHAVEWAAGLPVPRAHQMVAVAVAAYGPISAYRLARVLRASMRPIVHALRRLEAAGAVERRGQVWAVTSVMGDTNSVTGDTITSVTGDTNRVMGNTAGSVMGDTSSVTGDTRGSVTGDTTSVMGDTILVSPVTPFLSTEILCAGPPLSLEVLLPPYNPLSSPNLSHPRHPTTIDLTHRKSTNNLSLDQTNDSVELTLNGTRDSQNETRANQDCDPEPATGRIATGDQVATQQMPGSSPALPGTSAHARGGRRRKRTPTRPTIANSPQSSGITDPRAPSACHDNLPAVQPAIHHPAVQSQGAPGSETWEAYASAYEARYGSRPPRNARVNSMCLQLVRRVGAQDAPRLARWYVERAGGIHMRARHPLSLLLRDCEVLLVEMRDWRPAFGREWEQQRREIVEGIEWAMQQGLVFVGTQPKQTGGQTGGHNGNGRHTG